MYGYGWVGYALIICVSVSNMFARESVCACALNLGRMRRIQSLQPHTLIIPNDQIPQTIVYFFANSLTRQNDCSCLDGLFSGKQKNHVI